MAMVVLLMRMPIASMGTGYEPMIMLRMAVRTMIVLIMCMGMRLGRVGMCHKPIMLTA